MNYAFNPIDSIISFVDSEFTKNSVFQLLCEVGYTNILCILEPCTASHAVLVDRTTNYSFTSVELGWLHSVDSIMEFRASDCYNIFVAEMSCNINDYYIYCAAIIKIFEKAFNHNSIYLFKINDSVAFGSLRDANRMIQNNYIISKLCNEENIVDFSDFLDNIFVEEMDNIPFLISEYSPLKNIENDYYYKSYVDRIYDENEYINALLEIQSIYGVDTSKERERSSILLEESSNQSIDFDCSELCFVAEDTNQMTSYEELINASSVIEKVMPISDDDSQSLFLEEDLPHVSEDAYENAEKMLEELLEK